MNSIGFILALPVLTIAILYNPQVSAGSATLTDNVFNNVVVEIAAVDTFENSHNVDSFLNTLEDLLQNTSEVMYAATGNRLSFGTITIVLLANWENQNSTRSIRNVRSSNIMYNPQTLDTADILIDVTNVAYDFMPYTQQSGFCGERGDFIHITYNFITGNYDQSKYGSQSNLLAREWIKYYFGVYDEQGYNYDYMYPVKYFAPGAVPVLNLCTTTYPSWEYNYCNVQSAVLGLPLACNLEVGQYQSINTSMMSLPLTPVASQFCSRGNHNPDAPNKQNVMCDGKSIMEVVLQNSQVKNSESFKLAQANITVSQLTSNNTLATAIFWDNMEFDTTAYSSLPSISKFIQYDLPLNSSISFQESVKEDMTQSWSQINSEEDRTAVLNSIAEVATDVNDTNLINAFQNLIESAEEMSSNIKLLLFISSSDISSDNWTSMCEMATEHNFQMRLISYSTTSVINFMTNSKCIGEAILIPSVIITNCPSPDVYPCCVYLQQRRLFDEFSRAIPNSVAPNLYGPPQTFYEATSLDIVQSNVYTTYTSNIEDNLFTERIYFETCENMNLSESAKPSCMIIDPEKFINCTLDSNATLTYCANEDISPSTESWGYYCSMGVYPPSYIPSGVYAVGQPSNAIGDPNKPAVNLYSWTVIDYPFTSSLNANVTRIRIFARFVIGTTPVFNAIVQATAIGSNNNVVTISLVDDGSGSPDVSVNDGIYSGYFANLASDVVYTITVSAESGENPPTSFPNSSYPWISGLQPMDTTTMEPVKRIVSAGSLYTDPSKQILNPLYLPPGRIMDLHVISSTNSEVSLQWTAPGLYLDYLLGGYYLKCSTDKFDINVTNFNPTNNLYFASSVHAGSITQHAIYEDDDDQTHYCSVMTCNTFNNQMLCSEPSNIATYSIINGTIHNNNRRHHNIVLWSCIAAAIVLLLIILVILIILVCTGRITFIYNLYPKTKTTSDTANETPSANDTAGPMELNDMTDSNGEKQTPFLDQPPSYDDTIIN